ncbi:MAG TPA: cytochrome c [Woeseiaceae bacterium]|nr:cytochrome c [Woeseiaceae bacterium]
MAETSMLLLTRAALAVAALVMLSAGARAEIAATSLAEKGRYLATAGNCRTCHTHEGGKPFAGGVPFVTPFGTIYSTNITPDPQTGIGGWSAEEFSDALHEGVRADGKHLYPVFPYTAFTKLSDEDTAALFAYVQSLTPVQYVPPENDLGFPYSQRWGLGLWKALYFDEGKFVPNEHKSVEWNRGAYLVEGLGHCGMCHTPRNFMGASDEDLALTGGTYKDKIQGNLLDWSASNLTSSSSGLASWSVEDIAGYLKLGFTQRASVFGPMNEVVVNSTRHLSMDDVRAMAVYLKSLPANAQDGDDAADDEVLRAGSLQYDIHCGTCHLPTGLGSESTGPPLVGSPVVLATDPASLINITLYGAQLPERAPSEEWRARSWKVMEPFAQKMSDEDVAALLSYVRSAWGNAAGEVTPEQVAVQRQGFSE